MVYFDKQPVVSGYIYEPAPGFGAKGAAFEIVVTSPVAKYIGQSAEKGKTYYNQSAAAVLADLCPDIRLESRSSKFLPKFVTYGSEHIDGIIQNSAEKPTALSIPAPSGS